MLAANLSKFNRLPREERRLFVQAVILLPFIHISLNLAGYARLYSGMEKLAPLKAIDECSPQPEILARGQVIARIVAIAAQHGLYRVSCLRKSLLVWWFLRREGISSQICFGVRTAAERLEAHAWVVCHGIVLDDPSNLYKNYRALQVALSASTQGL